MKKMQTNQAFTSPADPEASRAEELASEIGEKYGAKEKFRKMCRQNPLALISLIVICLIIVLAVLAPVIAPYKEAQQDLQIGRAHV